MNELDSTAEELKEGEEAQQATDINQEQEELKRLAMLEELQQLKRVDKTISNFAFFVETYLSAHKPTKSPKFHDEIYAVLNAPHPRTLIVAPRGFAKSTLASRFFTLYLSTTSQAKDIIIVSATVALAKESLRMIRNEFETNELLIKDYGFQKSEKWTEDHLILANGTQIRAKGRGFQIRGFRPDVIVCDDLEDEEVIYSKDQRDKMEAWFFRTLLPALKPNQRLVYIGTILHQYSLINKLKEKDEFKKLSFKALTDGKSIWEELFPTEYLEKLKIEMGFYAFEAEYQNNPVALENQPIKPHMFAEKKNEAKRKISVLALDPAISESEIADYSAITIFERTEDHKFNLVYKEKGHYGIDTLCDRMIHIFKEFHPDRILIEEFAYQKVIRSVLTDKGRTQNLFLPISTATVGRDSAPGKPDKRPMDKLTRLLQVLPLFEQKLVFIDDEEVKQELLAFPFGDHDDLVDSAVYALYFLMKWQTGAAVSKGVDNSKQVFDIRPSVHLTQDRNGNWIAQHAPMKIVIESNLINVGKPRNSQ